MNIKVINLSTGEESIKDHKKLVKKLVEKDRVTREQRDYFFENPYYLRLNVKNGGIKIP